VGPQWLNEERNDTLMETIRLETMDSIDFEQAEVQDMELFADELDAHYNSCVVSSSTCLSSASCGSSCASCACCFSSLCCFCP